MAKPAYKDVSDSTRARMRAVRRQNTTPEILVRKLLHSLGYRFRLHRQDLPGKPDIVLPRHKRIILVHGCFWHGHEQCRRSKLPSNNREIWRKKIDRNKSRDTCVNASLHSLGWISLIIWECEVRDKEGLTKRLLQFMSNS